MDMPAVFCGPTFENLPPVHTQRTEVLIDVEDMFRIIQKIVEEILTLKEEEESARQVEEA